MKKTIKTFALFLTILLGLGLTACNKGSLTIGKPKGKEVQYSNFELERKFDRLKFENKTDKFIQIREKSSYHEEDIDDYYGRTRDYTMIKDASNNDLWLNIKYSDYEDDGKKEVTVKGYESKNYTYFDINYTNNKKFDYETDNIDIYNGKYKVKKGEDRWFGQENSLYGSLRNYRVYFDDDLDFEDAYYYFEENLFLELNEISYKKLKFYETNELFTVELKITLADLKEEKDDFYDIIDDWFYLPDNIEDLNEFNIHYLFVFEKNHLIEVGYKESVDFSEYENNDDEYNKIKHNVTFIITYTNKKPKEFKYSDYDQIEDSEDIIK